VPYVHVDNKKNNMVFENFLFKCVTRPDLSGVYSNEMCTDSKVYFAEYFFSIRYLYKAGAYPGIRTYACAYTRSEKVNM